MSLACSYCSTPARTTAKFCQSCGRPLNTQFAPISMGQSLDSGRYTVQRPLSKGGMGVIYLATDHATFERPVVIKAMLDYFDTSNPREVQTARERFLQEAKTLSQLRHPAIPPIFSFFADGPHNYIVMEHIEGSDLASELSRIDRVTGTIVAGHAYPISDVLRWGITLCRVLEYLAARKPDPVVHHDIKPANLLVDSSTNEVRLVDFGTAKARLAQGATGTVGIQKSSVFGTDGYAPPEQYRGQSEPRSDVYALAATLYHLVTDDDPGDHPFSFPQLNRLGSLGAVLERALAPDVEQRPSAAMFRQMLQAPSILIARSSITTPTGAKLEAVRDLVHWCEQNWRAAASWVFDDDDLPRQIETIWGNRLLATELRERQKDNQQDRSAGLDNILTSLDPIGFGATQPTLSLPSGQLTFGPEPSSAERTIAVQNTGRRYVSAKLSTPRWLVSNLPTLSLIPGEVTQITLTANIRWGSIQSNATLDRLMIQMETTHLADIHVKRICQINSVVTAWPKIVNTIAVAYPQLQWYITDTRPLDIEGETLVLFAQKGEMQRQILAREDIVDLLQRELGKEMSWPRAIRITASQLEEIQITWPQLVEGLRGESRLVYAQMEGVTPINIEEQTVVLLASKGKWQKSMLEQEKTRKLLERMLTKALKSTAHIRITTDVHDEMSDVRKQVQHARNDPLVRQALNIFDAVVFAIDTL